MDKAWMLQSLKQRIPELEQKYRGYFDLETGPSKSYSGSACLRSRTKKDLDLCKLLEAILMGCSDSLEIQSEELEQVFNRLVEPRRRS